MRTCRRFVLAFACAALLCAGRAAPAWAHPHVWAQVQTALIIENGAIAGLRHTWVFDKAYLASALEEYDSDHDGTLTAEELAPLTKLSLDTLKEFKSFTVVRAGRAEVPLESPRDVVTRYEGDLLALQFIVSLAKPVPLRGSEVQLEVYDPTYYSVFEFAAANPITFVDAPPAGCEAQIVPARGGPQQKAVKQFALLYGRGAGALLSPKTVVVSCKD
jgi:ABC-type uncharacterized transport system substrate-binding protein